MQATRLLYLALTVTASLALAACDDDPPASRGGDAPLPTRDQGLPPPDAFVLPADMAPPAPDQAPPAPDMEVAEYRYLVLEGAAEQGLHFGQRLALSLRYLNADDTPAAGSVKIKLLDAQGADRTAAGIDGTTVDRSDARVDAEGRATYTLAAGQQATVITVEASADLAQPVRWTVRITRDPLGGAAVRVIYPAGGRYPAQALARAEVGLLAGTCADALGVPRAGLGFAHRLPDLEPFDGDEITAQGGLPDGVTYAAIAWATGAAGVTLAWGCVDGLTIRGGEIVQISVPLADDPLEYKGTFNVEHALELSELLAAQGDAWRTLATILDVLRAVGAEPGQRGQLIVGLLCGQLGVGPDECGFLQLFVGPLLDQLIEEAAPPEALQALAVIGDLAEILGRPRVVGQMVFTDSFPNQDGLLLANESRWQGFRFAWRNGCDFPDRARCERVLSLVDDAGLDQRSIAAPFDARVEADDRLAIGAHIMRLHFGRIALGVLEAWLLPEIFGVPGPMRLVDFFGRLIPCADLNAAVPPFDPRSGVCEATVLRPLADGVTEAIENLGLGVNVMSLQGHVTVADRAFDRQVDQLLEGVWDMAFGDAEDVLPETGSWHGCRVGHCPEDQP